MNLTAARNRIERIRRAADDGEELKATQLEEDLVHDALVAIAGGARDARMLASVVIQSFDMGFQRIH